MRKGNMIKIHKIKVVAEPNYLQTQPDTYYTPIVVQDQFNNKYLAISHYEAQAIMWLLERLQKESGNYNTGDWFHDLSVKIKKYMEIAYPPKLTKRKRYSDG